MTGERRALIVANGEYENPGLSALRSPAADAGALAEVLADRTISDFTVQVVRDETAHVIAGRVEDLFADSAPDDVLLLHFSCHGLKSESGELFFAARNTRPERLASTAVPADFVQRCMRMSRSRSIVLLLDCCYGGAFSQGVAVRASGEAGVLDAFPGGGFGGRGRAVITASNSIEYAFEGDHLADDNIRPSVFTSALVDGLRTGDADRDEDGWIALSELYDYLFDSVRERNPNQTPSRDIEMQGELYLARSRRRRIKPSPVPADLRAASEDPNMFTRLGAVTELRRRLTSENLPVAVGAYEVLASMAQNDIQHIAEAADLARREARVRAQPDVLRFGDVVQGTRPVARIRLEGPPIARVCRFVSSHGRLKVTEVADGAEISLEGAEIGVFDGRITVTGPAGELVVAVEGRVVAAPEPEPAPEPEFRQEPERARQPEPAPEPVSRPEPVRKPEPREVPGLPAPQVWPSSAAAGVAGLLGIAAGLYLLILSVSVSDDIEEFFEYGAWAVALRALFTIGAGIATIVMKTRRLVGPGALCGLTVPAIVPFGSTPYLLAGLVMLLAAICALVAVRRDPGSRLGFGKPQGFGVAGLLLGIMATTGLAVEAGELFEYSSSGADEATIFLVAAVLFLVGTVLGALVRPPSFGLTFLAGLGAGAVTVVVVLYRGMPSSSSVNGAGWVIALVATVVWLFVSGFGAVKAAKEG